MTADAALLSLAILLIVIAAVHAARALRDPSPPDQHRCRHRWPDEVYEPVPEGTIFRRVDCERCGYPIDVARLRNLSPGQREYLFGRRREASER